MIRPRLDGFDTARLGVRDWSVALGDPAARADLGAALAPVLTPSVLRHLPDRLALDPAAPDIDRWIDARAAEQQVFTVSSEDGLVGLLFLREGQGTCRIGYLLAEAYWGKGHATELVRGLATALAGRGPVTLLAGVAAANRASARVLRKVGFRPSAETWEDGVEVFERSVR